MIIAIDPSIANPGYAVFRVPHGPTANPRDIVSLYFTSGQWYTDARDDHAERLAYLAQQCRRLCEEYPPVRAYVEVPAVAGVYAARRVGRAGMSQGTKDAIIGGGVGTMQQAAGVFLATLAAYCPTETAKPTAPGRPRAGQAKNARREFVARYWPDLADAPYDETDAVYLALAKATDARIKWPRRKMSESHNNQGGENAVR